MFKQKKILLIFILLFLILGCSGCKPPEVYTFEPGYQMPGGASDITIKLLPDGNLDIWTTGDTGHPFLRVIDDAAEIFEENNWYIPTKIGCINAAIRYEDLTGFDPTGAILDPAQGGIWNQGFFHSEADVGTGNSRVPGLWPPDGAPSNWVPSVCLDAPGSEDVRLSFFEVKDDPESVLHYAGLAWQNPDDGNTIHVDILDDGTVVVDERGYTATDNTGATWATRQVNGRFVMVKK